MSYIYIAVGIIILAVVTYVIIQYVYGKSTIKDLLPTSTSLAAVTNVYDSDSVKTNLLTTGGSSVMGFFNVRLGDRTMHVGKEFQKLVGVDGSFTFNVSQSGAQLVITTSNGSRTTETIELPTFPMQKWVFLAILRDGRRFDVIYNDRIVASHRLEYFPAVTSNPLTVGNPALLGNVIHVIVAPYRLTPTEVAVQRARLSDTNGAPPSAQDTKFGMPAIPFSGLHVKCLPGIPCNPVTQPPSNHLKAWSTPYN